MSDLPNAARMLATAFLRGEWSRDELLVRGKQVLLKPRDEVRLATVVSAQPFRSCINLCTLGGPPPGTTSTPSKPPQSLNIVTNHELSCKTSIAAAGRPSAVRLYT